MPTYTVGVLTPNIAHLYDDWQAGISAAVISIRWDQWEPTQGAVSAAYRDRIIATTQAYRAAGYQIGISPGLHYPPAWAVALGEHTDQAGNTSGHPDYQWSPAVRVAAEAHLTSVVTHVGQYASWMRVGLSKSGETLLPTPGATQSWWAYGTLPQTGVGLPVGMTVCPYPGWRPGETTWSGAPFTAAMAETWHTWLIDANVRSHAWQINAWRAAGWAGPIHTVSPGTGVLRDYLQAKWDALLDILPGETILAANSCGAWQIVYPALAGLVDLSGVWLDCSSVYDGSGSPRGNVTQPGDDLVDLDYEEVEDWSSARLLSSLARRCGMAGVVGENPGSNTPAEVDPIFTTARGCGMTMLLWAFDDQLHSGPYATLAQVGAQTRR